MKKFYTLIITTLCLSTSITNVSIASQANEDVAQFKDATTQTAVSAMASQQPSFMQLMQVMPNLPLEQRNLLLNYLASKNEPVENLNKAVGLYLVNYIQTLPPEVLMLAFNFLDAKQLVKCSEVCTSWVDISRDKTLWRSKRVTLEYWQFENIEHKGPVSKWPVMCLEMTMEHVDHHSKNVRYFDTIAKIFNIFPGVIDLEIDTRGSSLWRGPKSNLSMLLQLTKLTTSSEFITSISGFESVLKNLQVLVTDDEYPDSIDFGPLESLQEFELSNPDGVNDILGMKIDSEDPSTCDKLLQSLMTLSSRTSLTSLTVGSVMFPCDDLPHKHALGVLSSLTNLRKLDISTTPLSKIKTASGNGMTIGDLNLSPSLTSLNLSGIELEETTLEGISALENLMHLKITLGTEKAAFIIPYVAAIPNLKNIMIYPPFSEQDNGKDHRLDFSHLAILNKPESITLNSFNINLTMPSDCLLNLTTLELGACNLDGPLENINAPNLRYLNVWGQGQVLDVTKCNWPSFARLTRIPGYGLASVPQVIGTENFPHLRLT